MTQPSQPADVQFGVFKLDLRAGELRKQGLKIKLQEKPFRVLAVLRAGPISAEAHDAYLKGRFWASKRVRDKAVQFFDEAIAAEANFALPATYIKVEPAYDPIRSEPRLQRIVERMNFPPDKPSR